MVFPKCLARGGGLFFVGVGNLEDFLILSFLNLRRLQVFLKFFLVGRDKKQKKAFGGPGFCCF